MEPQRLKQTLALFEWWVQLFQIPFILFNMNSYIFAKMDFLNSGNLPSVISKYFLCYHRFDISHWREVFFPSTEPTLFVECSLFRNLI